MPEKITDIQKARQSKRQKMSLMHWLQVEIWLTLWMIRAMMKKINRPLLEHEKQTTPLTGEVSPEQARIKAMAFAVQERARLKQKTKKQ